MDQSPRLPTQRQADSFLYRHIVPVGFSIITSFIGGVAGAYLTLQLHEYRLNQLEGHVQRDSTQFEVLNERTNALTREMAGIHERHRLEDLGVVSRLRDARDDRLLREARQNTAKDPNETASVKKRRTK